ncbi:MAG: XkdX family protein [Synergistaceae bacterium]|nr:XkdX family protein [Synergistaceae bacterium]
MSEFAAKVKRYYELGLWDLSRVANAVKKGALTAEEYALITGKQYNG